MVSYIQDTLVANVVTLNVARIQDFEKDRGAGGGLRGSPPREFEF